MRKMFTYFVSAKTGADIVKERLKKTYDDVYEHDDNLFLLRTEDELDKVVDFLEIKGDDGKRNAEVAVFELKGRFGGYDHSSLWDWMKISEFRTYA